jgi:putative iron-dependent peroxidase
MSEPQAGIIPEPSESTLFLVLRVHNRERDGRAVARIAARVPALTARIAKAEPRGRLVSVVAFGPELWDAVSPGKRPAGLRPFRAIETDELRAPATGGDLLLHALARRPDLCFELASQLRRELGELALVLDEVHGFKYLDSRDLTGFIDGTENPKGKKARSEVALIGGEDEAFAGGSYRAGLADPPAHAGAHAGDLGRRAARPPDELHAGRFRRELLRTESEGAEGGRARLA